VLRVTMADTTQLLMAASFIGAIDVFYFHLWRLRLYRQASSVVEELTHLAAYGSFIAIGVVLVSADSAHQVRGPVLGLFAVHLAVTAVDVLVERSSRAGLGGLPPVEYLLHVLVTFGIGGAAATFWWASSTQAVAALDGVDRTRVVGSIVFTAALLAVEGTLLARSVMRRRHHGRLVPPVELGRAMPQAVGR
jgi:hypothetical protein